MPVAVFLKAVADGWRTIFLATAVAVAIGGAYSIFASREFRAETVVVPVDRSSQTALLRQLGQFGALASLAGIGTPADNQAEALAVLKSKNFCREFIVANALEDRLLDARRRSALGRITSLRSEAPDIRDAVDYFHRKVLSVTENRKDGTVTVTVEWGDPKLAADWANGLILRLNSQMRDRALAEGGRNVEFLQKELSQTTVTSLQQSLGRLLEAEMQKVMLARGTDDYAYRIVDAAVPPRKASWPRRGLILSTSVLIGMLVGAALVMSRRRKGTDVL